MVSCLLPLNVCLSVDGLYMLVPSKEAVTVLVSMITLASGYMNSPVLFVVKVFGLPFTLTIIVALGMISPVSFVSIPVIFIFLSNISSLILLIMIFVFILYDIKEDLFSDGRYL